MLVDSVLEEAGICSAVREAFMSYWSIPGKCILHKWVWARSLVFAWRTDDTQNPGVSEVRI